MKRTLADLQNYNVSVFLRCERDRRVRCEGPPGNVFIQEYPDGTKQRMQSNGSVWDINNPCVRCSDEEIRRIIEELSAGAATRCPNSLCTNPLNDDLMRLLVFWRKHVKETFREAQKSGETNGQKDQYVRHKGWCHFHTSIYKYTCDFYGYFGISGSEGFHCKKYCDDSSFYEWKKLNKQECSSLGALKRIRILL